MEETEARQVATAALGATAFLFLVNWATYKTTGQPLVYCWVRQTVGTGLYQLYDVTRAFLFVTALLVIPTARVKYIFPAWSALVLWLMLPVFAWELFSFCAACG